MRRLPRTATAASPSPPPPAPAPPPPRVASAFLLALVVFSNHCSLSRIYKNYLTVASLMYALRGFPMPSSRNYLLLNRCSALKAYQQALNHGTRE